MHMCGYVCVYVRVVHQHMILQANDSTARTVPFHVLPISLLQGLQDVAPFQWQFSGTVVLGAEGLCGNHHNHLHHPLLKDIPACISGRLAFKQRMLTPEFFIVMSKGIS